MEPEGASDEVEERTASIGGNLRRRLVARQYRSVANAFELVIQDPSSTSATLLEQLLEAADTCERAGAAFSFASRSGVDLLLDDPLFVNFLSRGAMDLIVGIDAVTTPAALDRLHSAERSASDLSCRAFVHSRTGALFHPKFIWFGNESEIVVMAGSGNLTRGGLLGNWEAFGHARLSRSAGASVVARWNAWLESVQERLRPVDDKQVRARAEANAAAAVPHAEDEFERADATAGLSPPDAAVLIAEIPRSGSRWNQANFDRSTFQEFFELIPGRIQRIVLMPVDASGTVGAPEVRQGVSVESQNYRIELGAAAGIAYPADGAPLGVFVRLGTRRFRYRVLFPSDAQYGTVRQLAQRHWAGPANRKMRVRIDTTELRMGAPSLRV